MKIWIIGLLIIGLLSGCLRDVETAQAEVEANQKLCNETLHTLGLNGTMTAKAEVVGGNMGVNIDYHCLAIENGAIQHLWCNQ